MVAIVIILMILFLAGIIYFIVQIVLFIVMEGFLAGLLIWKVAYKVEARFQILNRIELPCENNREIVPIEQISCNEILKAE